MVATIAATLLTACGATADPDPDVGAPADPMAMCAPEAPDCVDTVLAGDPGSMGVDGDAPMSDEDHRARARTLLGLTEAELTDDIRIGARDGEAMMLTEDYVIGRRTVALEDDGTGTYVVTAVVLELESGPETLR